MDRESASWAKRAEDGLEDPLKGADEEQALNLKTEEMAQLAGKKEPGKTPVIPGLCKERTF